MKKSVKIIIMIVVILFVICALTLMGGIIYYNQSLKSINSESNGENVQIEITDGMGVSEIAELLKENNLIQNPFTFKVYLKLNNKTNLQAGKYDFNNGIDGVEQIVQKLNGGDIVNETVEITFVEGKNMRYIAKTISENTNNSEDDVFDLLSDEDYIKSLEEKYWFITDEIAQKGIYYPLEGYLLPDTYTFENADVSVEEIFDKILGYTDKYLTAYRDVIDESGLTVHQILTIASICELEGKSDDDRANIVGVFFNRLEKGMSLGSDVTTYYAVKKELTDGDLTKKELATESPYNTRWSGMNGYIPIGPIDNPSKSSIQAVLNYKQNDYLYFVSDINEHIYFSATYEEHEEIIKQLKDSNLWYTYEE